MRDKTELLNLKLYNLPSAKVLLKLEFDTKDQVLFTIFFKIYLMIVQKVQGFVQKTIMSYHGTFPIPKYTV